MANLYGSIVSTIAINQFKRFSIFILIGQIIRYSNTRAVFQFLKIYLFNRSTISNYELNDINASKIQIDINWPQIYWLVHITMWKTSYQFIWTFHYLYNYDYWINWFFKYINASKNTQTYWNDFANLKYLLHKFFYTLQVFSETLVCI